MHSMREHAARTQAQSAHSIQLYTSATCAWYYFIYERFCLASAANTNNREIRLHILQTSTHIRQLVRARSLTLSHHHRQPCSCKSTSCTAINNGKHSEHSIGVFKCDFSVYWRVVTQRYTQLLLIIFLFSFCSFRLFVCSNAIIRRRCRIKCMISFYLRIWIVRIYILSWTDLAIH